MIQTYIVIVIGILTAAYIIGSVVRAIVPRKGAGVRGCTGCTSCPVPGGGKYKDLCKPDS